VSVLKGAYLCLSDFVNEYDLPITSIPTATAIVTSTSMRVAEGILNWRASTGGLLARICRDAGASAGIAGARVTPAAGSAGELAAHRGACGRAAGRTAGYGTWYCPLAMALPLMALSSTCAAGRDGKSLTLLVHPGRIKTAGPNVAIGPALRAGKRGAAHRRSATGPGAGKTLASAAAVAAAIMPQQWTVPSNGAPGRRCGSSSQRRWMPAPRCAGAARPDIGAWHGGLAAGETEWRSRRRRPGVPADIYYGCIRNWKTRRAIACVRPSSRPGKALNSATTKVGASLSSTNNLSGDCHV
jgi:hypothetical protein